MKHLWMTVQLTLETVPTCCRRLILADFWFLLASREAAPRQPDVHIHGGLILGAFLVVTHRFDSEPGNLFLLPFLTSVFFVLSWLSEPCHLIFTQPFQILHSFLTMWTTSLRRMRKLYKTGLEREFWGTTHRWMLLASMWWRRVLHQRLSPTTICSGNMTLNLIWLQQALQNDGKLFDKFFGPNKWNFV